MNPPEFNAPAMEYRKFYPALWFIVDYELSAATLQFTAWKIEALGEHEDEHTIEPDPHAIGSIRFDGCMNVKFDESIHFCCLTHAKQHAALLEELYKEGALQFNDPTFLT